MSHRACIIAALFLALANPAARAQGKKITGNEKFSDVVTKVQVRFEPAQAKPGDVVTWRLSFEIAEGWHTYPTSQPPGIAEITEIDPVNDPALEPMGAPRESGVSSTHLHLDGTEYTWLEGPVSFEQRFRVTNRAAAGDRQFVLPTRLSVCYKDGCLPLEVLKVPAALTIVGGTTTAPGSNDPTPPHPKAKANGGMSTSAPPNTAPAPPTESPSAYASPADAEAYKAMMDALAQRLVATEAPRYSGLWEFLLMGVFWGAVSLFTPCVFPMIPITVSFFLKQSERSHISPVMSAFVYCGTIVTVLGAAALLLLGFFSALSTTPLMNLCLGLLFIVLALSLFGMFELTLPSFLTRYTSSREGQGGLYGTVFMALTFTVVSFTCVAPFLGGFGGMADSGQFTWWELVLGALAFSATFASPFLLLALFPSLMRKLPKSGAWLHSVKVVMGFIELAAGLKFLRAAELVFGSEADLFSYDFVLGAWVVISISCGLYLLKLLHVGEDEIETTGASVPRLMTGLAFVCLGIYLLPGLFAGSGDGSNHRPRGKVFAWVDSFLLPEHAAADKQGLPWGGDLRKAVDEAAAERARTGRPAYVFVDFTGELCTNCKFNEHEIFPQKDVTTSLTKYRLVQLYTDKVPNALYPPAIRGQLQGVARQRADAEVNKEFQKAVVAGVVSLPQYVILEPLPDGKIRVEGIYPEAKINSVEKFVKFLQDPLSRKS